MAIYKRGNIYHFNFWWRDRHIQKSTRQSNPRVARQMEAAYRTALAKGEVGIVDRKPAPSFGEAMKDFLSWSERQHQAHPRTYRRYRVSSVALFRYFKDVSLDQIAMDDVERFMSGADESANKANLKASHGESRTCVLESTVQLHDSGGSSTSKSCQSGEVSR